MPTPLCSPLLPPGLQRWLALDTSTERLSVAVGAAGANAPLASHEGPGGAQASATLLPTIDALLREVDWALAALDGIVFGQGPGSFTGLRTACAVVQGLAVAARPGGVPVLPLGTLWTVAEQARVAAAPHAEALHVVAALDARMDEIYAAHYLWTAQGGWRALSPPRLYAPAQLPTSVPAAHAQGEAAHPEASTGDPLHPAEASACGQASDVSEAVPTLLAGNVATVYGERLPSAWHGPRAVPAWPSAAALLRLVPAGLDAGLCTTAMGAQPLYVRDKVALTVDEQAALRAQRLTTP